MRGFSYCGRPTFEQRLTAASEACARADTRTRTKVPFIRRPPSAPGSKLDPFKDEIHRLLKEESELPGQRVRELIEPLRFDGGKTIMDDYLREVRALLARRGPFSGRSKRLLSPIAAGRSVSHAGRVLSVVVAAQTSLSLALARPRYGR